ncbi:MAG: site-specific recombinase [Acidimicrobiaceae bacterium]|jgi:DNA invertase Pin-like site-specific DNA recombinase
MTLRIGIYTRLSHDSTGGEQTATARQEKACRAFAELRGWDVAEVFEDVDLSAYKRGVVRPSYERMLEQIASGRISGVVVWKLDRLVRRPTEFERFWSVCEKADAFIASAMEPIDASTDLGIALVRILVTFAQLESATISVRITAKHRESAEAGKPPPGLAPFGWVKGMRELDPAEAELIREAARRMLDGDNVYAISRDWFDRGVRSKRGAPISSSVLRNTLVAPRLVGDRAYHGEVVARDCFPAVLDRATFALVGASLSGRHHQGWSTRAKYELTGLLRCGRCGARMRCRHAAPRRVYVCSSRIGAGCNRVYASAAQLEQHMLDCVLEELRQRPPEPPDPLPVEQVAELLEAHATALREIAQATGLSDGERGARQAALVGALQRETGLILLGGHQPIESGWRDAAALKAAWPTMPAADRRAVYATHFHYVVVNPSPNAYGTFRPERVCPVTWASEADHPGEGLLRVAESWQAPARPRRSRTRIGPPPLRGRNQRYRPDRELLTALRSWVESTDDPKLLAYEAYYRAHPGMPSSSTIARRFGGWRRALKRVGRFSVRQERRSFSDEELRDALRVWIDTGGDRRAATYSAAVAGQPDRPSFTTVVLRFGSWPAAMAEIGEESAGRRWTPEQVLEAVACWLDEHEGAGPSDYANAARGNPNLPSTATLAARVGKWRDVVDRVHAARGNSLHTLQM